MRRFREPDIEAAAPPSSSVRHLLRRAMVVAMPLSIRCLPLFLLLGPVFVSACDTGSEPNPQSGTGGSAAGAAGTSTAAGSGGLAGSQAGGGAASGSSAGGQAGAAGASGTGTGGTSAAGGGGGGAAGSGTGGGGAGPGGAAGTGCSALSGALFCEDFEGLAPGALAAKAGKYMPVVGNGTLMVDTMHARGTQALHVHTDGNGKAYVQVSPFAPPQNSFYGRAFVWVTAFPSAPDYAHYTLVEATGTQPGSIRPIGGQFIQGKGALWGVGSDGGPTGDWTNWKETAPAEAGKWLCLEWQLESANNAINVWINGTAKTELSVDTKNHGGSSGDFVFPTFNSTWFGWWLYQQNPTPAGFDLWFDDVALSTQRLGCGSP